MSFTMYYSSSGKRWPNLEEELVICLSCSNRIDERTFLLLQDITRRYPIMPSLGMQCEYPFAVATYVERPDEFLGYIIRFGYYVEECSFPGWKCFFQVSANKAKEIGVTALLKMMEFHHLDASRKFEKMAVVALGCRPDSRIGSLL